MARSMLKRKTVETESVMEYGGGIKCMMNGVIYYSGVDNVLEAEARREMRAALWSTKIVEEDFDEERQPRVKIVYVHQKPLSSDKQAVKSITTIVKAEKEKEKKEGRKGPRLIFVKQDMAYWPGSDPPLLEEEMSSMPMRPDFKEIYVPEDEKATKAYPHDFSKRCFMRYFDPSLPGTKFILDNLPPSDRASVLREYEEDHPELWKAWMSVSSQHDQEPALHQYSEGTGDKQEGTWDKQGI